MLNRRLLDSPSLEEVWISILESMWTAYGVCGHVNSISSIFLLVDINFESCYNHVLALFLNAP